MIEEIIKKIHEQHNPVEPFDITHALKPLTKNFADYYYFKIDEKKTSAEINIWMSFYIPVINLAEHSVCIFSFFAEALTANKILTAPYVTLNLDTYSDESAALLMHGKQLVTALNKIDALSNLDKKDREDLEMVNDCFKQSVYDTSFIDFFSTTIKEHLKPYLQGQIKDSMLVTENLDTKTFIQEFEYQSISLHRSFFEGKYSFEKPIYYLGETPFMQLLTIISNQEKKKNFKELEQKLNNNLPEKIEKLKLKL